jgi:probable HAF family extracellular repeat protein
MPTSAAKCIRWILALVLFGVAYSSGDCLAQTYQVTDVGTLGGTTTTGFAINSSGQVVGSSTTSGNAATHAFLYTGGVITDLGTLGGDTSEAFAINDAGTIVGYASTAANADHGALWTNGSITDIGTAGTASSYAYSINSAGTVVGAVGGSREPPLSYQSCDLGGSPAVWSGGSVTILPGLDFSNGKAIAYSVNDSGTIAGCSNQMANQTFYAVQWTSGSITQMTFAGEFESEAFAINSAGVLAGQVERPLSMFAAAVWTNGTLQQLNCPVYFPCFAYGISSTGEIVGASYNHAALWTSSVNGVDLNGAISPQAQAAVTLTSAIAVNTSGAIVANGTLKASGDQHAFLLTPISGPPTVTLSASPASVTPGEAINLSWSTTNAWTCTAGGSGPGGAPWSGSESLSGSASIVAGPTVGQLTFTLTCARGAQSSATASASVMVSNPPPKSSGGGGTFDWLTLSALAALGAIKYHRSPRPAFPLS